MYYSYSCFLLTDKTQHPQLHQKWPLHPDLGPHMYAEHTSFLSVITLYSNYLLASLPPY